MSYLNKLHKHIDITVVNGKEYTFTCTVCKYTEQRLQLTAKGDELCKKRFVKAHEKCGKKLTQTVSK